MLESETSIRHSTIDSNLRQNLTASLSAPRTLKVAASVTIFNLLWLFIRPQNDLKILATLQVPFIINSIPALFWFGHFHRTWTTITKLIVLVLIQGCIWVPLAVNNFWAFQMFRGLLQLSLGIIFPIVVFCCYPDQLRRILKVFTFSLFYLSLYGLSHAGKGPGDYLGDENDLGLALCFLLGFLLARLLSPLPRKRLLLWGIIAFIGTGALVATESRGTFVGFVGVCGYLFLKSRQKLLFIVAGFLIATAAVAFAPSDYWSEISSISNTNEGTAKKRRDYWNVALRVFLDPKNIVWGVGMGNVPFRSGEYEPSSNKSSHGTSMSGRQVHSFYFQLLPELGLIGIFTVGGIILLSWRSNASGLKQTGKLYRDLPKIEKNRELENVDRALLKRLRGESQFFGSLFLGLNCAWIGVMLCGAFLSVLYYPPIWLLAGLTVATRKAWDRIRRGVYNAYQKQEALSQDFVGAVEWNSETPA